MYLSGQDWEPVVLTKESKVKPLIKEKESAQRVMSIDIQQSIQKARLAVKMSQKDLAKKLNVNVDVIINYENGKAIPNNEFISKIEKILNTKLPRASKKVVTEE
jgi:putative transcription factor